MLKKIKFKILSSKSGFTLVEMLVAVAIFSIVLVVAMGAILTIIDANRKAQTLSSVMTNLNFALESMTRTIKTGVDPVLSGGVLEVDAIDLSGGDFTRRKISFKLDESSGQGQIVRRIGSSGSYIPITAPEVDITKMNFALYGESVPPTQSSGEFDQPRTLITIEGVVTISEDIQSTFRIQTTVSQRRLNIAGEESSG